MLFTGLFTRLCSGLCTGGLFTGLFTAPADLRHYPAQCLSPLQRSRVLVVVCGKRRDGVAADGIPAALLATVNLGDEGSGEKLIEDDGEKEL